MWISRKRFMALEGVVERLRDEIYKGPQYPVLTDQMIPQHSLWPQHLWPQHLHAQTVDEPINNVIGLILDHLGVKIKKVYQRDRIQLEPKEKS